MRKTLLPLLVTSLLDFPISLQAYELHEWGTFTTVSGSNGELLTGLQREEEHLPQYVQHHPRFGNHQPILAGQLNLPANPLFGKRIPIPAVNVTVKMETPVIYFHSEKGFHANVHVGFHGGTISQWYPSRSSGEVIDFSNRENQALDFSKPYTGSIHWEVDVLSREESNHAIRFKPDDLIQWTRARIPEANIVRSHDGSEEGFLFYRGLGSFDPGLRTTIQTDETLTLQNQTGSTIPFFLIYEKLADGTTHWLEHDGLPAGQSLVITESELPVFPSQEFDETLYRRLTHRLTDQGLLRSEAEAMVQTWWRSYFSTPGLRVFWVLPDGLTNSILPLEVDPTPKSTVRVLVGRSEILRPRQEQAWLEMASSSDPAVVAQWNALVFSDRFGLAYNQRVELMKLQTSHVLDSTIDD
ncbi:MAG: hypothetical protein ACQKBU_04965 [Verrucomicrobiales bacterium]